jgi:hypothetical protein
MGMHRSGTSLVAGLLQRFGVFIGKRLDVNHESVFFQNINEWLLHESGGSWACPKAIDQLLVDAQGRDLTVRFLEMFLQSPRAMSYTGIGRYMCCGGLRGLRTVWGWKDPRNTYTLPLWLELFPNAKVVNVSRHGVDVAQSLKVRRERRQAELASRVFRYRPYYNLALRRAWFPSGARCATIEGGLSLWEEYMDRGRQHAQQMSTRMLSIRYEDLLETPEPTLRKLVDFCELSASTNELVAARQGLDPTRAYAYRRDPSLALTAQRERALLDRFGYGE